MVRLVVVGIPDFPFRTSSCRTSRPDHASGFSAKSARYLRVGGLRVSFHANPVKFLLLKISTTYQRSDCFHNPIEYSEIILDNRRSIIYGRASISTFTSVIFGPRL